MYENIYLLIFKYFFYSILNNFYISILIKHYIESIIGLIRIKFEKIRENKKDKEEIIKNDKNKNIERKKENLNFKGEKLDHNGRVIFDPILSLDNPLCDPAPLVIHNPITISYSERVRIFQEYFDRTSAQ